MMSLELSDYGASSWKIVALTLVWERRRWSEWLRVGVVRRPPWQSATMSVAAGDPSRDWNDEMPDSLPQVDLRQIRQHEKSQQRGWEELSFILVPDIETLPPGTSLERRAAPDAGIEFSCPAPPGKGPGCWAWQCKFLDGLDASSFSQMTRSVKDALDKTPDLTRYTLILPVDRTVRGLERWSEHVLAWKDEAVARGMKVEFHYIGHSNILAALQLPKNTGALRYFFDKTQFTDDFFRKQVEREIENLGERYDPDVHVELEIGASFDALCRSPRFVQRLAGAFGEVERRARALGDATLEDAELASAISDAKGAILAAVSTARVAERRIGEPDDNVLRELANAASSPMSKLEAVEARIQQAARELRKREEAEAPSTATQTRGSKKRTTGVGPMDKDVEARRRALHSLEAGTWRLRSAIDDVLHLLSGVQADVAERAALLLDGPAGCGKSHLVAGIAKSRLGNGIPTLLILGQHLTNGAIWPQISESIGVDLTGPELLQILEVAARVRGAGRALIVVDAINEGGGAEVWRERLAGFLRDLSDHPWIAVALTVRDTYTSAVLPHDMSRQAVARLTHPGLAGHEEEALIRYAEHYQLRLPDVPSLHPELTNPLFLRSMCRSVQARGLSAIPREAASLTWVFSGLIEAVNIRLARPSRLDVDVADDLVGRAVAALATAMLEGDSEVLPVDVAKAICEALHPDQRRSRSLFEGLVTESLLLRELTHDLNGGSSVVDQVRFTYQRLADHLRAEELLSRHVSEAELARAVKELAMGSHAWSRTGLIEALVLLVPERRGRELASVLRLGPTASSQTASGPQKGRGATSGRPEWLRGVLESSFFNVLPWRDPRSITPKTRALLDRYLSAGVVSNYEWLNVLLGLACVPDHPLNVRVIDRALRRMTMPERDSEWSDELLDIWSDDSNPLSRTIEWAWSGRMQPPAEVTELAATLLAWLLTSPNRRLRDSATKGLLTLMEGRTGMLANLLQAFQGVDDPYIIERLLAVACGHAIRHRGVNPRGAFLDDFADVGRHAFDLAFGHPGPSEHLLIRHYGRTCIDVVGETLKTHGRTLDRDRERTIPPYGSAWPLTAPSVAELARRYGRKRTKYVTSATEMGYDFEHYVIERGIATDFVLPDQKRRQAARRSAAKRKARALESEIVSAAPARMRGSIKGRIENLLVSDDAREARAGWDALRKAVPSRLAAVDALERITSRLRFDGEPAVRLDPGLLARWIAARVLELGWSEERFGGRDRMLSHARSGRWEEAERFAKKYMWIAFYQLLGHLTDNCSLQEEWRGSRADPYDSPDQISFATDIDPTVQLRGDEPPEGTPAARVRALRAMGERQDAWWLAGYQHTLSSSGDDDDWLRYQEDVPLPLNMLTVEDPHGDEWLVLESHATWSVPEEGGPHDDERRQLWTRTQANLVPSHANRVVSAWAAEQNWMGLWMPTPSEHLTGYLGAYPDLSPWPELISQVDEERRPYDEGEADLGAGWEPIPTRARGGRAIELPDIPVALATSSYHNRASRDFSAMDLPRAILPSPLLLSLLRARWAAADQGRTEDLGLGPAEAEYSWLSSNEVVAFSSAGRRFGSPIVFCVKAGPLRQALADANLELWSWILGEKIYWTGGRPSNDRADIFGAAALVPSVALWGLTVEHQGWRHGSEVRKRVMTQRPIIKSTE